MTKSYSTDFRIKVVSFVKSGHSQIEAARIFNISKDSVKRWIKNNIDAFGSAFNALRNLFCSVNSC